ncbi:MAG: hypothetical protein WAW61_09205, partial [Methylococcaceae bacterium]
NEFLIFASESDSLNSRRLNLDQLGITKIERVEGTGYHQPLGCLIWYGNPEHVNNNRAEIESISVRNMILDVFAYA